MRNVYVLKSHPGPVISQAFVKIFLSLNVSKVTCVVGLCVARSGFPACGKCVVLCLCGCTEVLSPLCDK